MTQSYPSFSGHQRVDLADMLTVAQQVPASITEELGASFLLPQGGYSVVSGFRPYAADANTVAVGTVGIPNVAWLGRREGGIAKPPTLAACGPQTLSISISNYPSGTFGIFVRLAYTPLNPQQRIFWDQSGLQEVAQLTPTMLQAAWEVRIEANPPSTGEWMQIGSATVTAQGSGSGSTVVVGDMRRLYFEGQVGQGSAGTWGTASDRTVERGTFPISNLQTKLDAITTCLLDIKGRGISQWYDSQIRGMLVGTGFGLGDNPVANQLCVGDYNFFLRGSSNIPAVYFSGNSYLSFDRSASTFRLQSIGNALVMTSGGYSMLGMQPTSTPYMPFSVWNYGPYGRVAHFINADSSPGAIAIGNTTNAGGRIDFTFGDYTDFQSAFWRIATTHQSPFTFSVIGTQGTFLQVTNGASANGYSTVLQGNVTSIKGFDNIQLSATNGLYVNGLIYANTGILIGSYKVEPRTVPWMVFHNNNAANTFSYTGTFKGTLSVNLSTNGTATVDFSQPIPVNACIQVSAARDGGDPPWCSYAIQNNRSRMSIYTNGSGYFDFDISITQSLSA